MNIGIYHGYELTGSGSNEYTRYLAESFIKNGHSVHIICREPEPEKIPYITKAVKWTLDGEEILFTKNNTENEAVLHCLPHGKIRPVYLTDKQRDGIVKSFTDLSDDELKEYHELNEILLQKILTKETIDILHANHLVYQPEAALAPCVKAGVPLIIYPHGSSIEYTVRPDERYKKLAREALLGSTGIITGNDEVKNRILDIYPDIKEEMSGKMKIVGVGVDTELFQPVDATNREGSIKNLKKLLHGKGKNPEQTVELYHRIDNEGIGVTRDYWASYEHKSEDSNIKNKLENIPWDKNIILFVGALTVGKGIQSVLTALPFIIRDHPDTHFIIVGSGAYREVLEAYDYSIWKSDSELIMDICSHGKDLDRNELTGPWDDIKHFLNSGSNMQDLIGVGGRLKGHVHFLGRLDHSKLRYLFPCADLAVFPSVIPEAYPLVLMESLSNGVMPVVSYFSGFTDAVDEIVDLTGEKLNALMKIPIQDEIRIERIISNINSLLSESSIKTIKPMLASYAKENYDWEIRGRQMVDAYKSFI